MLKDNMSEEFDSVFKDTEESEETKIDYDFEKENAEFFNKTSIQLKAINELMILEIMLVENENNGSDSIIIKKEQVETIHDLLENVAKM